MRFLFEDCLFDSDSRILQRAGSSVHLTPKAFQLLELLIARRPHALSKEEIVEHLWPDTFVSDGSLANLVAEIRGATGDDAHRPHVVRTHQRYGYSFCGEASEAPPATFSLDLRPRHRLVLPKREIELIEGECLIGRAPDCQVRFDSTAVSRHHARLSIAGDEATLQDLGSKNGTYVRGRRLAEPAVLRDGDPVRFGSVRLVFRTGSPDSTTDSFTLRVKP